ncbi:MAG TPA: rRNA adenine dimethyltransferase family protein [Chloroflexota bacterium]|nr:rRNA adenine dimethyltransferase family protein [Chloroflexota bacterium]
MRHTIALAQNHFRDRRVIEQLVARSSIRSGDLVYEVGPGLGTITRALAQHEARVVAVEKDPNLARRLASQLASYANVTVHVSDFLTFPLPLWDYKLFANPPFNITAALLRRLFIEAECKPAAAYLVMEAAAAHRVIGLPKQTLFGLAIQPWFDATIFHRFDRRDFVPTPNVEIVMLRLSKRGPPLIPEQCAEAFAALVRQAFTGRSHDVRSTLRPLFGHERLRRVANDIGLDLRLPASQVTLGQWIALFGSLPTAQLS